eukprot:2164253-Prymnesium_polylepis.1
MALSLENARRECDRRAARVTVGTSVYYCVLRSAELPCSHVPQIHSPRWARRLACSTPWQLDRRTQGSRRAALANAACTP